MNKTKELSFHEKWEAVACLGQQITILQELKEDGKISEMYFNSQVKQMLDEADKL
jgi:hypothetical protein